MPPGVQMCLARCRKTGLSGPSAGRTACARFQIMVPRAPSGTRRGVGEAPATRQRDFSLKRYVCRSSSHADVKRIDLKSSRRICCLTNNAVRPLTLIGRSADCCPHKKSVCINRLDPRRGWHEWKAVYAFGGNTMKTWTKPEVREQEVGLEVTSYLPAEIDII